jgi:colicin import membrane protein
MNLKTFSSWKGSSWESQWMKMVSISLGLHLLILGLFLNIFPQGGTVKKLDPAYFVDLVSLPGNGAIGTTPKTKESLSAPSPPPPRVESKPVSIPKPVPEKPLPVEDRSKTLDQAMEQLKQKVLKEKSLEKTLSRLEDKVKDEQTLEKALAQIEKKKQVSSATGAGTGSGVSGSITSAAPGGQDGMGVQNQLYYASLISRVNKNWSLPEGLIKGKDISAVIVIQISRHGKIEDAKFEKKSGIGAFDQEVLRAIKKSDPLPPLPEGFHRNIFGFGEVGLTFSPKGLSGK